jgi:hypothetical protein
LEATIHHHFRHTRINIGATTLLFLVIILVSISIKVIAFSQICMGKTKDTTKKHPMKARGMATEPKLGRYKAFPPNTMIAPPASAASKKPLPGYHPRPRQIAPWVTPMKEELNIPLGFDVKTANNHWCLKTHCTLIATTVVTIKKTCQSRMKGSNLRHQDNRFATEGHWQDCIQTKACQGSTPWWLL